MWWVWLVTALAAPQGRYALADGPEAARSRVDAAIDVAASEFGLFKGIARARLGQAATICDAYEVDLTGDPLSYRCDGLDPLVTPLEALGVRRTLTLPRGPTPVTVAWAGQVLEVRFEGDDGGRVNRFRFGTDGELLLDVELHSARLSRPVTWTLRYHRVDSN